VLRLLATLCVLSVSIPVGAATFEDWATGRTLRVDYVHTGIASEEHFALERLRVEGEWPGSRTQTLDTTNRGKYMVEVADLATHRVLYTRGFASIYGEWETTGEARKGVWRAIPEAVRIPEPKGPVQLRLRKRQDDQSFREVWSVTIDPASRFVDRAPLAEGDSVSIVDSGPAATKVDLVILGDGYAGAQREKFVADARRASDALFEFDPFRARKGDFNVRAVFTPAAHEGISRPRAGVFRDSPLGARYNSFDSERYVLTLDDRAWRDAAAIVPYDFVLILVNERKYGGGGIFGLYSTAAMGGSYADYLVVHEFGHHFAGLGDEYYTSPVAYEDFAGGRVEPWEPNVTALLEPGTIKWADLMERGTPLPTPWEKEAYEEFSRAYQKQRAELRDAGATEEQMEALFDEVREQNTRTLGAEKFAGKVGAFEGAMYEATGFYRPSADCIMFTRDEVGFCAVCAHAVEEIIDLYAE
jgi:hypothetical protein